MKFQRIKGIALISFLAAYFTLFFYVPRAEAAPTIRKVPNKYPTIQAAVNAAKPGDTILVAAGTYYEHVFVDKAVRLIGQNRSTTIIDGSGTGNPITISADNVIVSGFTIRNSGESPNSGVFLYSSGDCFIQNNNVTLNFYGIRVDSSSNIVVTDNILIYNKWGIFLWQSSDSTVRDNFLMYSEIGIYLYGSSGSTVKDNEASHISPYAIFVVSSTENTVNDNDLAYNRRGIYLLASTNNTVYDNKVTYNYEFGIVLWHSKLNSISDNNVTYNRYGITFYESSNNTIYDNHVAYNQIGVYLWRCDNTTIGYNNITFNGFGTYLYGSFNTTVEGNYFVRNSPYGIVIIDSSDNFIYHNNFISNESQVYSVTSISTWDKRYPFGGNYWSDYSGTDNYKGPDQNLPGGDGIGDSPYNIDATNLDRYPLMGPWKKIT